jgi:hypothetical protein
MEGFGAIFDRRAASLALGTCGLHGKIRIGSDRFADYASPSVVAVGAREGHCKGGDARERDEPIRNPCGPSRALANRIPSQIFWQASSPIVGQTTAINRAFYFVFLLSFRIRRPFNLLNPHVYPEAESIGSEGMSRKTIQRLHHGNDRPTLTAGDLG